VATLERPLELRKPSSKDEPSNDRADGLDQECVLLEVPP